MKAKSAVLAWVFAYLMFASFGAIAATPLAASFDKSFTNGAFGPFGPGESVVITATLTNLSASNSLTICEGFCIGDVNTYALGGWTTLPTGYSFYFGNSPDTAIPFDGQVTGTLLPGTSKDFIYGVFTPNPGLAPGWYGFANRIQIFDATPERNYLTASTFSGNWQVVATAPVPEPETYAMLLAGLGLLGGIARRKRTEAPATLLASASMDTNLPVVMHSMRRSRISPGHWGGKAFLHFD